MMSNIYLCGVSCTLIQAFAYTLNQHNDKWFHSAQALVGPPYFTYIKSL